MARRSFVGYITPLVKVSPANQKLGFGSLGFLIVFLRVRNLSFQSLNKTFLLFLGTTCLACLVNKPDSHFDDTFYHLVAFLGYHIEGFLRS